MQNLFKVNNKDIKTRSMTSLWCLYCQLLVYLTPFSSAFYCWSRTDNCLLGNKHLLNRRSSIHFQVWLCLSRLTCHKIQKVKNMGSSILTGALNFARELCLQTVLKSFQAWGNLRQRHSLFVDGFIMILFSKGSFNKVSEYLL